MIEKDALIRAGTAHAPEGQVWICAACGKRARSRYGFDAQNRSTALDSGWDESCMLHAVLCYAERGSDGLYQPVEMPSNEPKEAACE